MSSEKIDKRVIIKPSIGKIILGQPILGSKDKLSCTESAIILNMGGYLGHNVLSLLGTSRRFYGLFYQDKNKKQYSVDALLYCVTRNNLKKIDQMPHLELLLGKADVIDPAGRKFKQVTAYQYALWAKNFPLIKLIEKKVLCADGSKGDKIRDGLLLQRKELKGRGLHYTLDGKSYHEIRYNLRPLMNIINHFDVDIVWGLEDHPIVLSILNKFITDWNAAITQLRLAPIHLHEALMAEPVLRSARSFSLDREEKWGYINRLCNLLRAVQTRVKELWDFEQMLKSSLINDDTIYITDRVYVTSFNLDLEPNINPEPLTGSSCIIC